MLLRRFAIVFGLLAATVSACSRRENRPEPAPSRGTSPVVAEPAPVVPADSTPGSVRADTTPGNSRRIRIRGRTGPYTGNPLIIVDGVRYETSRDSAGRPLGWPTLSPSEIESVEMLQGPAALERYGPAAKDGVLIILTKRTVDGTASPKDPE